MPLRGRLALWYFLMIGSAGTLGPWLAVVLARAGADATSTALILSIFPLGVLFAGPVGSWLADRPGREQPVLRACALLAAVAGFCLLLSSGLWTLAAAVLGVAVFRAPLIAITDMYTVRQVGWSRTGYGAVRGWGSIGFIVGAFGVGAVMDRAPIAPQAIHAAALGVLALMAFALPRRTESPVARVAGMGSPRPLLRHPVLLSLYGVAVLHRAAISFYDAFFALHTTAMGLPSWVPGAAIAVGVSVEVLVLRGGHRLLERFGPFALVAAGVAASVPRWLLTGSLTDPLALILVQSLHGVSFAAWWVGTLALIARCCPEPLRNTGQSLLLAAGDGIGTLLAMGLAVPLLAGPSTGDAFLWTAGLSGLALLVVVFGLAPALRKERAVCAVATGQADPMDSAGPGSPLP